MQRSRAEDAEGLARETETLGELVPMQVPLGTARDPVLLA